MPKLPTKDAKAVADTEAWSSGPRLLPEGRYAGRLHQVTERDGNEYPQWSWWFTQIHDADGKTYGGTQFLNTSLSPKARGGLKSAFDAFGYSTDSSTDEMLGEWAVLYISTQIPTQGKNAGTKQNRVDSIAEFVPDEWDFDPSAVPADKARDESGSGSGSRSKDTF